MIDKSTAHVYLLCIQNPLEKLMNIQGAKGKFKIYKEYNEKNYFSNHIDFREYDD